MAHPLRRRLGRERQLVAWAHLPRDAHAGILEQVVVHPLIAVEIEFARHTLIHAPVAARREEPEPVMLERRKQPDRCAPADSLEHPRHESNTAKGFRALQHPP